MQKIPDMPPTINQSHPTLGWGHHNQEAVNWLADNHENIRHSLNLIEQMAGALNFILAFYEPSQTYLDTNAWVNAEAAGRRALKSAKALGHFGGKLEPELIFKINAANAAFEATKTSTHFAVIYETDTEEFYEGFSSPEEAARVFHSAYTTAGVETSAPRLVLVLGPIEAYLERSENDEIYRAASNLDSSVSMHR